MSSKSKKTAEFATDGRLVQTRIPPEDYTAVEKMAKASRLSMASMLRTMIASQADAYRAAQKSLSMGEEGEFPSPLPDEGVAGSKIVKIASCDNSPVGGVGLFALTAAGDVLYLVRTGKVLSWAKLDAVRDAV